MPSYQRRRDDNHAEIAEALRRCGWYVVDTSNCPSAPGMADLTCIRRGRVMLVEVKARAGRQRDRQRILQALWEQVGGEYVVVRDMGDVERVSEVGRGG